MATFSQTLQYVSPYFNQFSNGPAYSPLRAHPKVTGSQSRGAAERRAACLVSCLMRKGFSDWKGSVFSAALTKSLLKAASCRWRSCVKHGFLHSAWPTQPVCLTKRQLSNTQPVELGCITFGCCLGLGWFYPLVSSPGKWVRWVPWCIKKFPLDLTLLS